MMDREMRSMTMPAHDGREHSTARPAAAASEVIAREVSQGLVEAMADAIIVVDHDGRIVLANAATEHLLGYEHGELIGQAVETLVPNALRERHRLHRARYAEQPEARRMGEAMGLQAVRKNGSLVNVDIALTPLQTSKGPLTVCAIRDATERAHITEALQASENRFRTLADQATDGIFISDADGRYVAVNDAACNMLGYTREQLLQMSIRDLIDPREHDRLPAEIARLADAGPVRSEWRFRRQDGTTFQGEVNARRLADSRLLAVLRDVSERKRQEDEQRQARRFIEAVAKASPSWIYVFDLDDLSIHYLNRSVLRDLGYPPESEHLTRLDDLRSFIPPEDHARLTQLIRTWVDLPNEHVHAAEYRVHDAAGAIRWFFGRETVFSRHPDGRVHQVLGTLDDITEQKRSSEALRRSEQRWQFALEGARDGVWEWDPQTGAAFYGTRWQEMLGYAEGELGSTRDEWSSRVHPDDLAEATATIDEHLRGATPYFSSEHRMHHREGRWIWVLDRGKVVERDQAGRPVRVVGTMTDITPLKLAIERLQESEKRFRTLIHDLDVGVLLQDPADDTILLANRAAEEMLGIGGPMLGRLSSHTWPWRLVREDGTDYAPADLPSVVAARTGTPVRNQIVGLLNEVAATRRWLQVTAIPRRGRGGRIRHVLVTMTDVTSRKVAEEQLRQSQKMQAIGQLAGGVAHDFNNLLTVIKGSTQLALHDLPPNATELREDLAAIQGATDRAALLTSQLLLFGRKAAWEDKIVDVNELVQRSAQMLGRLIDEDIDIATALSPILWTTRGDPAQLEQILFNLTLNARDAMPNGGTLTVTTRNTRVTEQDCRVDPARRPGRFVQLTVRDTGVGMTPEVRAHLFEPFFTTKGPGKGTGLGLSTVYGIVQQAGGFITVDTAVEAGTTFNVFLPAAVDHAETAQTGARPQPGATGTETVLVVEDESAVRSVIARLLRSHGFRVLDVASAAEALTLMERDTDRTIDLLLTDVVMPEVGGWELAQRARVLRPGLPILFMSGYHPEQFARQGALAEGDRLLRKPFTPQALTSEIRQLLDARRQSL